MNNDFISTLKGCDPNKLIGFLKHDPNLFIVEDNQKIHWLEYFYYSCPKRELEKLKDFIKNQINNFYIELENGGKISLPWYLYSRNKIDLLNYLIEQGAKVTNDSGFTVLHWIASKNDTSTISRVKLDELDLDIRDETTTGEPDRTPLHWAVQENSKDVAKILLSKGANPNAVDSDGQTPLHITAGEGNYVLAKTLLGYGADKSKKDKYGSTPYKYAKLYHPNNTKLLDILKPEK